MECRHVKLKALDRGRFGQNNGPGSQSCLFDCNPAVKTRTVVNAIPGFIIFYDRIFSEEAGHFRGFFIKRPQGFFREGITAQHHIPRTGIPVLENDALCLRGQDSGLLDAYSTAYLVLGEDYLNELETKIFEKTNLKPIKISAKENINIDALINNLVEIKPYQEISIVGDLINQGDFVLLVMPQDIQAPQGRLILPQVQIIRDLLDNKTIVICVTKENFLDTLKILNQNLKLIITDSQIFSFIAENTPKNIKITSFSILLARYKGDIKEFKKGADYIDKLKPNSKILIAEACTHVPLDEDIGRIKIPRLLKNYLGFDLKIEFSRGNNFPEDLTQYDLIIHCGACMFNKKFMLSRINQAKKQNIKITNYGLAIAKLNNILDKIYF